MLQPQVKINRKSVMQHIDRLNVIKALVLLEDEQIVRFKPVAAGMISHRTACHRSRQHDRPAHSYFYYLSAYQVALCQAKAL